MFMTLLQLKEVTSKEACDVFNGHGISDRVVYYNGKNTRWFLFGENPIIGHASMTKVGSGEKDSSHARFGKWYIAPEYRGSSLGAIYAGALIYYYLRKIMTSSHKVISLRAWDELVQKYENNGWNNTKKKFKGPFQELRKTFYFSWTDELMELEGFAGKLCEGIIYPGDYMTPSSVDVLT